MVKWPALPATELPRVFCVCGRSFTSDTALKVHIALMPKGEDHWEKTR